MLKTIAGYLGMNANKVLQARRALAFIKPHRKTISVIMAIMLLFRRPGAAHLQGGVRQARDERRTEPASSGRRLDHGCRRRQGSVERIFQLAQLEGAAGGQLQAPGHDYGEAPFPAPFLPPRRNGGGLMTRLNHGINGFVTGIWDLAFNILPGLIYLVISVVVMFRLDWRLSLLVVFFAPLPAMIGVAASHEQTARESALLYRWGVVFARFNEVLSGIVTVKSFAMEEAERKRFMGDVAEAHGIVRKGVVTDTKIGAAQNLVVMLAKTASIGFAIYLIQRGETTVGTLMAFLGYQGGLFGPVNSLTGVYQTLRKASISFDIVFSILDAEDHLQDAPHAAPVENVKGEVVFSNVSFGYSDERRVLNGIDLHVEPGETIAIVGPSGSGKTTMISLLQRFYDPTAGSILIDGTDLRGLQQRSLRQQIGVVLQDALVFNDTIGNNIAYGRPDATLEEIEAAARAANAHNFVSHLPGGYDFVVGERGCRISVGERQRISIARALLKNPSLLILLVQDALDRLIKGRTSFIIAHRLSTVVGAHKILVLKDGQIIESDNHDSLMKQDGYYASLVKCQSRGLLMAC
ncbi:ABC transporter, ATP-binding/membrane protein [Citrifermentans bemidjiense Bem]|uniref:ABC transporter, ATP-binding/membrane protein n=2 Tax=Citrifermentans bemidjiense TaxID=225194 RepID=E1P677_CITBB|nr:ABC transporter, ATP-binding/membrane protein [Citrifermentans bemidjiense Bem]